LVRKIIIIIIKILKKKDGGVGVLVVMLSR